MTALQGVGSRGGIRGTHTLSRRPGAVKSLSSCSQDPVDPDPASLWDGILSDQNSSPRFQSGENITIQSINWKRPRAKNKQCPPHLTRVFKKKGLKVIQGLGAAQWCPWCWSLLCMLASPCSLPLFSLCRRLATSSTLSPQPPDRQGNPQGSPWCSLWGTLESVGRPTSP